MKYPELQQIREVFDRHSDPGNAFFMKKYMKGRFDFFGIKTPLRRELSAPFLKKKALPAREELILLVYDLWEQPERELQYFALDLAGKCPERFSRDDYLFFGDLVTRKSWWDTVDFIAIHLVGEHLRRHTGLVTEVFNRWLPSDNMWLQRTVLLFQLGYKTRTDTRLLEAAIGHCSESGEFFIQKAIGWALREYSKTDPAWVRRFIESHSLPPLSAREGLKWLNRK